MPYHDDRILSLKKIKTTKIESYYQKICLSTSWIWTYRIALQTWTNMIMMSKWHWNYYWKLEKYGEKNILFYKDKNYIPDDLELWQDIIKMFHDHEMAGHPGELETYNSVRQHYWWLGM